MLTPPPLGDPYRSMPPPPLAASPRALPVTVHVRVFFGGTVTQMGAVMLIVGSLMTWLTVDIDDARALFEDERTFAVAPAKVTGVVVAPGSVRGGSATYAVEWLSHLGGRAHSGVSYTELPPHEGETLDAEFPPGHPERARLRGMRWTRIGRGGGAFLLFFLVPTIGLGLFAWGLARGRRALRLLREGEVARGTLVDKSPTGARINNRPVYALTFLFKTPDGAKHTVVVSTHETAPLEDELTEQLVYLASDPDQASMIDSLPGAPRILSDGTIAPDNVFYAAWAALVALAAVAVALVTPWLALRR